jgi:PAS domain S-box-containing protein
VSPGTLRRAAHQWPRSIPWLSGLFVALIVGLAAFEIVRSHAVAVDEAGRSLEVQARVLAEHTARGLETIDLVSRHIADEVRSGVVDRHDEAALHAHLRAQAVGLAQIEGIVLIDAEGRIEGSSSTFPVPAGLINVGGVAGFERLRHERADGLLVDRTRAGVMNPAVWIFPLGRRLENADGSFAGAVVAGGRVEYFQRFYRDVHLEEGSTITLLHRDGTLMARHPPLPGALGQRFEQFDAALQARARGGPGRLRMTSPEDGVDRFGATEFVAGYPLAVLVAREADEALAPWRAQALGTALRTLGLAALATSLLALLRRQFLRLDKARASLEHSRERFALAAAGSDEGIWDWDVAGDRIYASARARQLFGLPPGPDEQPRREWFASIRMHPDDVADRRSALEAHLRGDTPAYTGEYRVQHADGSYRWVRVRGLAERDAAGRPLRMAGSVTDVDARRRAEDALRVSEERYALAMTGSTGGHWVWDVATDALFVSGTVNQLFGLPVDTQPTSRAEYFRRITLHADDQPRVAQIDADVRSGRAERIDFEYRIVLPGERRMRWILTRAQSFRDAEGRTQRVAGVSVDVTERKRTEEALRLSEQRFALAVAGSHDGIVDWDLGADRMYTSERMLEMIGAPPAPTTRTRAQWMALLDLHPDDRARHAAELQRFLDGRDALREGEYRIRRADGAYRWVRVRNLCVRDADGRPLRLAGSVSDIDAYKRVEEALRESEERYALALAGSDDGVWDFDYVRRCVFASRRARQILHLAPEPEVQPMDEWHASLRLHPEDAPQRVAAMNAHLDGRTPAYEGEWRVRAGDGSYRWVRVRGVCVRDATGRPLRMAGSVSDIDSRKRAEESLRQSQERYALAVAGSDDGVWDWDFAAGLAFESARARELQGLPPGPELQPLPDLIESLRVHPDDAPLRAEGIRAHLAGETPAYEVEYRVRHDDGAYRWIRVRALCIRDADGKPVRMAGSVSDVDARRRAEEALREGEERLRRSEERFQLAVAGSNEGVWDWDLTTDSLFLSARAQELLWLAPGEPQRARREWIALTNYHPDDIALVRAALVEHLHGRTRHFKVEYRLQHHSGEWRWYRQRGVAVRDAAGRPLRMAGSMEDITDRKNAEAERERLEAELRQAQKLEAIGTLAGGIAHDFNNILAAILGYGEMAQKDAAEGTPIRRHVDAAMSAAQRAKSLVERILAFSRSGMGERVPVHVQSVVREALDAVASTLPPEVHLQQRLEAGDAAVLGDPTQVHQVVMNLAANAVQAMKGRGTLAVELERVTLHEQRCATSVLADGSYVRLAVRDTGSGIAPHLLERIFDPFFTTKEVGVGTGLGLSLVHGIVTDLGGGIDVRSHPGEGATFVVYLPWTSCVAAPAPVEEAIEAGGGETVLLVDDEEALVRLGEEMIAGLGYEPVGFTSSTAAFETFRAAPERFDAVLSDEAMPDMTGSELARRIRAIRGDIPIVLMSGYVTPALTHRARDAGVADVLSKPLAARDIARCLASALQR